VVRDVGIRDRINRGIGHESFHATRISDHGLVAIATSTLLGDTIGVGAARVFLGRTAACLDFGGGRVSRSTAATRGGGWITLAEEFNPPVGTATLDSRQSRGHGHDGRKRSESLRECRAKEVHLHDLNLTKVLRENVANGLAIIQILLPHHTPGHSQFLQTDEEYSKCTNNIHWVSDVRVTSRCSSFSYLNREVCPLIYSARFGMRHGLAFGWPAHLSGSARAGRLSAVWGR
jgi:hypothetical protein